MDDAHDVQPDIAFPLDTKRSRMLFAGAFVVAHVIAFLVGIRLHYDGPSTVSTLWLPSGVFLAALLLAPTRCWWWVAGVGFFTELTAAFATGGGFETMYADGRVWYPIANVGNLLEALLSATLIRTLLPRRVPRCSPQWLVGFVGIAMVISPAINAALGAWGLWITGVSDQVAETWRTWWFGDGMGVMVVTPAVLAWAARRRVGRHPVTSTVVEGVIVTVVTFSVATFIFIPEMDEIDALWRLPFAIAIPLLWAAFRLGLAATCSLIFGASILIALGVDMDRGPFTAMGDNPTERILIMQGFMAMTFLPMQMLAAGVSERMRMRERLDQELVVRREQQAHVERLVQEVNHRVRNNLGVIISMVEAADSDPATLLGRLRAMSRVHDQLSVSQWRPTDIGGVISAVVLPLVVESSDRVVMSGEPVRLPPEQCQSLAMALHELASNALRHGAMKDPGGHLEISWGMQDGNVALHWSETMADPPVGLVEGQGCRLIRGFIEFEMRGQANIQTTDDGLKCDIRFPLRANGPMLTNAAAKKAGPRID
ncbi:MASE1 domain-containing protein [Pyruvatibacter sp.]|uniref:MASE1 domain-containing protein n=1 Tax=Pyruvatibacter sp. TaxID=1981328 RepID=UPI0032EDA90C